MRKFSILLAFLLVILLQSASSVSALRYLSVQNSSIRLKEGGTNARWTDIVQNVSSTSVDATDTRIAHVDSSNKLWVKEGSASSQWNLVADRVLAVWLNRDRIFILNDNLDLYVKVGGLGSGWTLLQQNVVGAAVSNNRVLTISDYDGYQTTLAVKDGSLSAQWLTLAFPVATYKSDISLPSISVTDDRIAYTEGDFSGLYLKEGSAYSTWMSFIYYDTSSPAFEVALAGNRLCLNIIRYAKPAVICKEGPWYARFVTVHDNAYLDEVRPDRITVRAASANPSYPNNALMTLEGGLFQNSGWKVLDTGRYLLVNEYQ